MCRIVGFWDQNPKYSYHYSDILTRMRDSMAHGGPDDAGHYIDNTGAIALGHRRLSILDLSTLGHQPMISDDNRFVVTYNGEIYNFKEIRSELICYGYRFHSTSDTEVLLAAFQKWGIECLMKLRGMWAFALWDKEQERLLLCRDRLGVKPLYWYFKKGLFMFASELKAFHQHPLFVKEINNEALGDFFRYGHVQSPQSIFENTYTLEPGFILVVEKNGAIKKSHYWHVESYFNDDVYTELSQKSEKDIEKELLEIVTESFFLRMVSDVPVGVFLSGGIDSSLLTAVLQSNRVSPLKTFTIGFQEQDYDESIWAKKIAHHLRTDHTEYICTTKDALNIISLLPTVYDEPFGDSSAIPTYLVSQLARQSVKVVLSADGGDEQFFGYSRYQIVSRMRTLFRNPLIRNTASALFHSLSASQAQCVYSHLRKFISLPGNFLTKFDKLQSAFTEKNSSAYYDMSLRIFLDDDIRRLGLLPEKNVIDHQYPIDSDSDMMLCDLRSYLPDDILVKVDRASMAVGLEAREPFLDNKLIEYSSALPMKYKYHNGISKYILKKMLATYIPESFFMRPKQGFGIPISEWLSSELKDFRNHYLSQKNTEISTLLNQDAIISMNKEFEDGNRSLGPKIWLLLVFNMWYEKWM